MEKQKRYTTDFLFSTSSFWSGVGTIMNIPGNFYAYNTSMSGLEADEIAIENDFRMIGQDINDVIERVKEDSNILIFSE